MRRLLILLVLHISSFVAFAQMENPIDSLALLPQSTDSVKVVLLNKAAKFSFRTSPSDVIKYASEARTIAIRVNLVENQAVACYNIGVGHFFLGEYPEALSVLVEALEIYQRQAEKNALKIAQVLNLIGGIHLRENTPELALQSFLKAVQIYEEQGNVSQLVKMKMNIGEIYLKQGNLDEALRYEKEVLVVAKTPLVIAYANGIIGQIYEEKEDYDEALNYSMDALEGFKLAKQKDAIAEYSISLGRLKRKMGKLIDAEKCVKDGLTIAKEIESLNWIKQAYEELAGIYKDGRKYELAFAAQEQYMGLKDSIFNLENSNKILALQKEFEEGQQQAQLKLQETQIAQLEQRRSFMISIGTTLILAFTILAIAFRKNQHKKKLLEVSHQAIGEQNEEILAQQAAIEGKNKEIEQKNEAIISSLRYAKRIQQAFMPSEQEVIQQFDDAFILLQPRDLVSGDFFWFDTLKDTEGNTKKVVAAVDATGHGVPGALMSIIGLELLYEIVTLGKNTEADKILERLHQEVGNRLKQHEGDNKDGMDISLCVIDEQARTLEFAGAKNGVLMIQKGEERYISGDRKEIGGRNLKKETSRTFTKHTIPYEKGMRFYLYSDGFPDQFGGEQNRKFTSKAFKALLSQHHQESMITQQARLEKTLTEWMEQGQEKQIDDVMVMGFQLL